ncbi:MAG: diaminopimelate decarboxylase [Candidatus Aenigmatarchaeota archaeon]
MFVERFFVGNSMTKRKIVKRRRYQQRKKAKVVRERYVKPRWKFLSVDKKGIMHIGGASVKSIEKRYGTPVYVIVESELRDRLRRFKKAFPYPRLRPQYPGKSNTNLEILRIVREEGFDLDASSVGEIILGMLADFRPNEITFTNLYKTEQDIMFAARVGVMAITLDSFEEIKKVEKVGAILKKKIRVFIRFNPRIDVGNYSTKKHKYGINIGLAEKAVDSVLSSKHLELVGLHFHGSYIFNPKVYTIAAKRLLRIARYAHDKGARIRYIDLGGGFPYDGIHGSKEYFKPEDMGKKFVRDFSAMVEKLQLPAPILIFEPGKFIVSNTGVGLIKVISKKNMGKNRKLIVTDGSTYAFLPDVMIYHQSYDILPATKMRKKRIHQYTVAGCTCDCADVLATNRWMPSLVENDILAVMDCGAYSNAMSSNFNNLKRAPMIMIKESGSIKLIRRRDRYSEMFAPELDVLKVADPNELKKFYNMFRVNMNNVWKGSSKNGNEKHKKSGSR